MAPSLVQSVSATGTTNTSLTITLTATGAGNCLIVGVGGSQSTTNPTVSGITLGGVADHFASAKSLNNNAETDSEIWADPNCAGGQTSVVVSFNAGTGTNAAIAVWVTEWSGIVTASPVDQTNGASASGASFSSGATGTLAQASELVIGNVFADGASEAITGPGAPWTNLAQLSPTAGAGMVTSYEVVSSTAAQTYSGTLSPSNSLYTAVIATFKATAAGPAGTVQPRATVPVPRRQPRQRALWRGGPVPFRTGQAPRQPPQMAVPPRRKPVRVVFRGLAVPGIVPVAPPQFPRSAVPQRRRPVRAFIPAKPVIGAPPIPPGIPPAITSGGDRDYTIRVFREIRPGDVPGIGAQLPRLTGRAFAIPVPTDLDHATHAWEVVEQPLPVVEQPIAPPGPGKLELAASKALDVGRIFADPPYERHRKTCGSIRKIGGVMLTCGRKPGHQGKHSDRGLDWR